MDVKIEVKGLDTIEDTIKDIGEDFGVHFAEKTTDDFYNVAHDKIYDSFYEQYTPKQYKRTGNIRSIIRRENKQRRSAGWKTGGILVNPERGRQYNLISSERTIGEVGTTNWYEGLRFWDWSGKMHFFHANIATDIGSFSGIPDDLMTNYYDKYRNSYLPEETDKYVRDRLPFDKN